MFNNTDKPVDNAINNSPNDSPRPSKIRIILWTLAVALLLTPAIVMQFSNEVNWQLSDFVIAGVLMFAVGSTLELLFKSSNNRRYRLAGALTILTLFLLIWINAAVGIVGHANNDANLLYFAVLVTALIGSIAVRFKAQGMRLVLIACAVVQIVVTIIALVIESDATIASVDVSSNDASSNDVVINSYFSPLARSLLLNAVFVVLFLVAAGLFRRVVKIKSSE